jgi:hypothetical protein
VIRRVLALVACAFALASCRVDIAVDMTVEPDGTGTITVVATADAELVEAVPSLATDLALDDVVAAGWAVDGPTATADGGLTITLRHDFFSDAEASNLLNSIGPPFNQMSYVRNTSGEDTTNRLSGLLGLSDGFASFADEDLVAAVGSQPFADRLEQASATPESSLGATIRVSLPGAVDAEQTNGTEVDGGRLEWTVPMDGSILDWRALSVQTPGDDRWWARPLSMLALGLLVAWVAFMTVFIGYVAFARWRRARRRRPPRPTPA